MLKELNIKLEQLTELTKVAWIVEKKTYYNLIMVEKGIFTIMRRAKTQKEIIAILDKAIKFGVM